MAVTISGTSGLTYPDGTTQASGSQACKAWVNFNGYSPTPSIRASYNVSSVTYSTTGIYVINFTSALADANYAVTGTAGGTSQSGAGTKFWVNVDNNAGTAAPTTTTLTISVGYADTAFTNNSRVHVAVFR